VKIQVTGERPADAVNVNGCQQAAVIEVAVGLVSSVNGRTGGVTGLAEAADVPDIAQAAAGEAEANAIAAAAVDATSKVAAHSAAADPHGDRAWADSKFLPLTGGTVNGPLRVNGAANTYRHVAYQSGGVDRWQLQCDGISEAGSNAGSNLRLSARADDGSDLGLAWHVNRATRRTSFGTTSPLGDAWVTSVGAIGARDLGADPATAAGGSQYYSKGGKAYVKQGDGSVVQLGVVTSSKSAVFPTPTGAVSYAVWRAPKACTVTAVRGYRTGGTGATINASKNTFALLAADLSLSTADTWLSAGSLQNTAMAVGDTLTLRITGVTGTPTAVTIQVEMQG
jgi:hypothetical protein